jgi:hypothetical protein
MPPPWERRTCMPAYRSSQPRHQAPSFQTHLTASSCSFSVQRSPFSEQLRNCRAETTALPCLQAPRLGESHPTCRRLSGIAPNATLQRRAHAELTYRWGASHHHHRRDGDARQAASLGRLIAPIAMSLFIPPTVASKCAKRPANEVGAVYEQGHAR